jgi:DNA-binding NarL/FixJ family response regulator
MRLLLADDHEMVRDALASYLSNEGGAEVVTAADLPSARRFLADDGPFDIVLLDYDMPGMDGLTGLKQVLDENAGLRVALLSGNAHRTVVRQAISMGAAGFLPKTLAVASLIRAVEFMIAGEVYLPTSVLNDEDTSTGALGHDLTRREREVLQHICNGMANKEIARALDLQEVTVKLHVRTLCRKIGARNRTHAAMLATEANLL